MNEENEVKTEQVQPKQLGYDQNIANKLKHLECDAGEALLAIKIGVSVDSEGTKLGIGVQVLGPDLKKVRSMASEFITMAAQNVATAIRDAIKPMLTKEFTAPILRDSENEFADAIASKHTPETDNTKEENDGV